MVFSDLEKFTGGTTLKLTNDLPVSTLLTDSRKAVIEKGAIFFAIGGLPNYFKTIFRRQSVHDALSK